MRISIRLCALALVVKIIEEGEPDAPPANAPPRP
jgi:hypothetical protein